MHKRWRDLGRQIKSDVASHPEKYSLIPLDHPFIVPGGRFREMYYWDSYWTIQGSDGFGYSKLVFTRTPHCAAASRTISALKKKYKKDGKKHTFQR